MSKVKNPKLAKQGKMKIEMAEMQMPVVCKLHQEFKKAQTFAGVTIAACLHITKETAVLLKALKAGGATVAACGSNPLSTQDDVAAALAKEGINIFAWRGVTDEKYYWCLEKVLEFEPQITIDDGADLISLIHKKKKRLIKKIWAGQEETTTGIIRLKAMAKAGALKYPVLAINDTPTKHLFDNHYGTGQSTMDGLLRATNILLAGKTVVVGGYGDCSSGIAMRAHGLGARVIITEVQDLPALKAAMDSFEVMPMSKAASLGDVFITATGDRDVIVEDHIKKMKDGAILGNSGHFNVEIKVPDLEKMAKSKRTVRDELVEYTLKDGRRIYLIAEGRLMNLAAAEGHPSAVMDLSFAAQALTSAWIVVNYKGLENKVYDVPEEIDSRVAKLKLQLMGVKIDTLTPAQKKYLASWQEGT